MASVLWIVTWWRCSKPLALWDRLRAHNTGKYLPLFSFFWLQGGYLGRFRCFLCQLWWFGAIVWGVTLVGRVILLDRSGVLELVERFLHISWHGYVQYACLVFPVWCDSTVDTHSPILCDFIFFLECMYEVQCVLLSMLFYPKVVEHKGKSDSILFVAPQSRSDWCRHIYEWSEIFLERRVFLLCLPGLDHTFPSPS